MHHKGGFQRWKELITFPFEKFTVYQQTKKKTTTKEENSSSEYFSPSEGFCGEVSHVFQFPL